jgi:hypothetical protein
MIVWVTDAPSVAVEVARSDTKPLCPGWVSVAVLFAPDPLNGTETQVAPSS